MENKTEANNQRIGNPPVKIGSSMWFLQWGCLLSTVFLAGSSLNFLFQWLAYGNTWDIGGLIFSLVLSTIVYWFALTPGKVASLSKRGLIALFAVIVWGAGLPVIMRVLGY